MSAITSPVKNVTTCRVTAIWPKLNTPDTKFKAEGSFESKCAVDANDPDFIKLREKVDALIQAEHEAQVQKLKDDNKPGLVKNLSTVSPFTAEEDPETGEETGRILFKVKMTASGVSKKTGKPWKRKPDYFDGKGKKLTNPPMIGGGSILKFGVELAPYFTPKDKQSGVSFRMEGVQIIKLVSFGNRDAGDYGFGAEEDGDELENAQNDFGADNTGAAAGDDTDDDL